MTRARRRNARQRLYGDRFSRTVDEEVLHGIHWPDYRSRLSPYLLPRPGDSAEQAAAAIRLARSHELRMDEVADGEPGTLPPFPHWEGLR
jgi:hypothetical protein